MQSWYKMFDQKHDLTTLRTKKPRIFAYLRNQENTRKASMFSIFPQIDRAYWEKEWTLCFQGTHFGWFLRIILSYPAWRSEKYRKWCLVEKHDRNKRNELSEKMLRLWYFEKSKDLKCPPGSRLFRHQFSSLCSRLSDSGEDAKEKGRRKVGGVSSRFSFVFALSRFSGPDDLRAWNRLPV